MLRQKLSRIKYFLLVGLLSASFAVGLVAPAYAANAAESDISTELSGQVLDHQLYYYILSCFAQADIDKVTSEEVKEWRWFWGGQERAVRGDMYENEYTKCSEGQWLEEAFGRFGFTDPLDAFCSLSFTYNRETGGNGQTENGGDSTTACKSGIDVGDFDGSGSRSDQAKAAAALLNSSPKGDKAAGALSSPAEYVRKYRTFMQGCEITITDKYDEQADPAAKSDNVYKVPIVRRDAEGKATVEYYTGQGLRSGFIQSLVATSTGGSKTTNCGELVSDIRALAPAYAAYLGSEAGQDDTTDQDEQTGAAEPVCSAGALGWIFCPISEFMVDAITGIAGFLEEQLTFEPLTFGPQGEAIRAMWGMVLVIANVGLIIAFLMVVFSQATSVGISSYGIKKLLPKIIAAAILMNLSFYICAVAVDISNILGVSVKSIVDAGMGAVYENRTDDSQVGASFGQTAIALTTGVMVGAIAVGTGAIALILPVLVSGVLAIFTAFLIIAAREVIIIILIVAAPLAFLAWILPNTESWFTKWRKLFTTMLVMFPMVMAIFYGSVLVSSLIMATSTNESGASNLNDLMVNVLAFAVLIVPLFSLPFVMKSAGGVMDRLGILVNNRNKGVVDRSRKYSQDKRANTAARFAGAEWGKDQNNLRGKFKRGAASGARFTGGYTARRDFKKTSLKSDADRIQQNLIAEQLQDEGSKLAARSTLRGDTGRAIARARGVAIQDKAIGEELSAARTVIENMGFENTALWDLAADGSAKNMQGHTLSGGFYQKAAQQMMLSQGQMPAVERMIKNATADNMEQDVRESLIYNISQNYPTLKAKAHGLNDDSVKQLILRGEQVQDADLQMAAGSKVSGLTKEQFAGQDAVSLKQALDGINSGYIRGDKRAKILQLANDAAADPNLAKAFGVESRQHLESLLTLSSAPEPPPPADLQARIDRNKSYSENPPAPPAGP